MAATEHAESSELSPKVGTVQEAMQHSIMTVCRIYNEDLRNWHEVHKRKVGEDLAKIFGYLLIFPVNNVLPEQNLENCDEGIFNGEKPKTSCEFADQFSKDGEHKNNFGSVIQFATS